MQNETNSMDDVAVWLELHLRAESIRSRGFVSRSRGFVHVHMAAGVGNRILGVCTDEGYEGHYEWYWNLTAGRATRRAKGTTGWGRIVNSTNPVLMVGWTYKIHLCQHDPCTARHPPSTYGLDTPPPIHMRQVGTIAVAGAGAPPPPPAPGSAVAPTTAAAPSTDAPSPPVVATAVADTSTKGSPPAPPAPEAPAPPAVPPAAAESLPEAPPPPEVVPAGAEPSTDAPSPPVGATAVAEPEAPAPPAVPPAAAESLPDAPPPPEVVPAVAEPSTDAPSPPVGATAVAEPEAPAPPAVPPAAAESLPDAPPPPEVVPAVAESLPEAPPPASPLEPAPVVLPVTVVGPAVEVPPPVPTQAALLSFKAAAPAAPVDLTDDGDDIASAVAVTAAASARVAAKHRIDTALLALARKLRRPREYVGYSAFALMGMLMKCQPIVLEGSVCINLLETYVPWALDLCTRVTNVVAIPCVLKSSCRGLAQCFPISAENPLGDTGHFVAGTFMPVDEAAVAVSNPTFDVFYAARGVALLPTLCDGDCGPDVMTYILSRPQTLDSRTELRIAISDYLLERIDCPWMHDLMATLQEVKWEDVKLYRSGGTQIVEIGAAPTFVAPAVAEPADQSANDEKVVEVDEETFAAMRWLSKLDNDVMVMDLIRSLPEAIVEEQVRVYRGRASTAVAERADAGTKKIVVTDRPKHVVQMSVAERFHRHLHEYGQAVAKKLPWGFVQDFVRDNITFTNRKTKLEANRLQRWYASWKRTMPAALAAVAGPAEEPLPSKKSLLRSRAPVPLYARKRSFGGGRQCAAPLVRQALYEWWTSIRFAIDWKQLIAENRKRGKKHLARFPRTVIRLKVYELLQDHVYACLLNGSPMASFKPTSCWFKRWEEDYGLSMRCANRKYKVPRDVLKERLEVFWVNLFRIRMLMHCEFKQPDPLIINFDQSPFHHNETGAQDKTIMSVRGSTVPVVEGAADVKSRWTANLTTYSRFAAVAGGDMPYAECMFKGEKDGVIHNRCKEYLRSRGFPKWFTVTVAPKGSYREQDVIEFLKTHLEPWYEGRDWRILLVDDYSAHRTDNVWLLAWERGYILLLHGGGATPVAQTPDTDLNEHVKRLYASKEARLLIEKMRCNESVPKLKPEECMSLMFEVLSDPQLHKDASEGYKKVGQSIHLFGKEDALIVREAAQFWNAATTDNYPSMRPKINDEIAAVAEEWETGALKWRMQDVKNLITPYPARKEVDEILERLGEDYCEDEVHALYDEDKVDRASEAGDEAVPAISSDEETLCDGEILVAEEAEETAVAGDAAVVAVAAVAGSDGGHEDVSEAMEISSLSDSQAEAVQRLQMTIAGLEEVLERTRKLGAVRCVQRIEEELNAERRKLRALINAEPAVAETFLRLRAAQEQEALLQKRRNALVSDRKRQAEQAVAERDEALKALKKAKKSLQDMEWQRELRHAMKRYTVEALGKGTANAGGARGKKARFEVLDRLARSQAGLSEGQRNDWTWFKTEWDNAMVDEHKANWAEVFSGWVQHVMSDERSNAFSEFVYNETMRVLSGVAALHVPGC